MASATSPDVSNPPTVRPFIRTFPGVPHGFRMKLDHGAVQLLPEILSFLDMALNHHGVGIH